MTTEEMLKGEENSHKDNDTSDFQTDDKFSGDGHEDGKGKRKPRPWFRNYDEISQMTRMTMM